MTYVLKQPIILYNNIQILTFPLHSVEKWVLSILINFNL